MLKVVSNTTPIISLLKLSKLDILFELTKKEVWISDKLINEILKLVGEN
jgi:predicted nucleic acid-binding protein